MNQVILIDNRQEISDLLNINLTNLLEAEVIPKSNAYEAMELMDILPDIPLIICRNSIDGSDSAGTILEFLRTHQSQTKVIILGDLPPKFTSAGVTEIKDPKNWRKVLQSAAKLLGVPLKDINANQPLPYSPIPAKYFLHLTSCCCSVYVRIKKKEDDDQYVKIIKWGDTFPAEKVEKYINQKLKFFYVESDKLQDFINFISDQLVSKIKKFGDSHLEEIMPVLSDSYDVATAEIAKLGFTSATIQLTESIVNSMIVTFKKNPDLGPALRKMFNAKSGYMFRHSHMTFIVAAQIVQNLANKGQVFLKSIGMASFFHDLCLVENEKFAVITSFKELEEAKLSEKDYQKVLNHAHDAAALLKDHPEVPKNAINMVRHHHGSSTGKNFDTNDFSKLSEIDKIFFVSCDFVKEFLTFDKKKGKEKPAPITYQLRKKYFDPDISKAIDALEKTLKKQSQQKTHIV